MQNSPIGWVGGKRLLRDRILKRFPDHVTYVEVFSGAAWILFAKEPKTSKVEVLNDANRELINFFRCVREKPLELTSALQFRLVGQDDFAQAKEALSCKIVPGNETESAARFFWFIKTSFGAKLARANFGYSLKDKHFFDAQKIWQIISKAHERLKSVYIFSEDFEKLIARPDRPETLFYCDPPYYGAEKVYTGDFCRQDHERLADVLKGIKGKFLLSYGDHAEIRKLYAWAKTEVVETRYSMNKGNGKAVSEVLISNF